MTLNTTYKPAVAQGNGIIKEFSYSFNPISSSYIKVYFEIEGKWVEQKTGWSATVSDNGGVVTFLNAPNTRVSIERDVPESQPTSYTTSSGFQASVIEHSFDLLTGMVQELKDASDRSVKVEVGDNQTSEELLQTVYDKLDSATEIAGDAISAANQAQTAADNATAAVNSAEQTLANVTAYVDSAKVEIDSTVAQAKADVNSAIDEATMDISNIVSDAEGSITNIAVTEANKAIANAAQEATDMAAANLNSYVDGTVKPPLQTYVDQAQENANSAATSMEQAALSATSASNYASNASADADNAAESAGLAANSAAAAKVSEANAKASETNALIWAEGTDAQVQALGGEKSAKGWAEASTNVNYTNCITEIPQDIKLELKDGVLTLKAGSKVYVPNGFEADGTTPKFDETIVQNDLTLKSGTWETGLYTLTYSTTFDNIGQATFDRSISGETEPTVKYSFCYDTKTNLMKYKNENSEIISGYSLPIAICNNPDGKKFISIDQVFNGFGYIGSTIFALPGVKGLIPNGRNADGSLKNIEFTTSSVITHTLTDLDSYTRIFHLRDDYKILSIISANAVYDSVKNIVYNKTSPTDNLGCFCGELVTVDGVITSFTPKTAFNAVDRNDSSWIAQQAMPSEKYIDLTLGASGTTYTAPANGWFTILKSATSKGQYMQCRNNITGLGIETHAIANNTVPRQFIPAAKGQKVVFSYTVAGTLTFFRFVYAEGEN